ncbi:MAG TPA: sulfatase-like hydrolase/transferase [Burkholderiales bacterium]|nr:sulfatase-like hydrolase/transferase [Burkholderiales bacterium]
MAAPNFVFILADDLGYADLGCYGARAQVTPRLDRMAAQGLRFTDGYSNSPVCSPTRFALMTGRYQYRLRGAAEEPIHGGARGRADLGLPPSHPTLPSLLRDAGYATALAGKWHLGYPPHFGPLKSGYSESFGPLGGGIDYFTHCDRGGVHDLFENDVEVHRVGYATDLISDRAVEFIARQRGARAPFLLSVHYTAPHWPWETRADEAESRRIHKAIQHVDGGSVEIYQTMIHHMDEGIGRILDALDAAGLGEQTLVVFTSDNGAERFSDSWPFVGKKMDLLEGGIRVPLVARWPAVIRPAGVTRQVAITMDWAATFLAAAGVAPHPDYPLDGVDLGATLGDPTALRPSELFWRMKHRRQRAVRAGDWKYLEMDGYQYLFDLAQDGRERANLAKRYPERLAELRAKLEAWHATMPPIPAEAGVSLVYGDAEIPNPSG